MKQLEFDIIEGRKQKESGQDLVERHAPDFVEEMRRYAYMVASRHGKVTSDDLRKYAADCELTPHHPNAWGSIFKSNHWVTVGFTRSAVVSNHARTIRIWALK